MKRLALVLIVTAVLALPAAALAATGQTAQTARMTLRAKTSHGVSEARAAVEVMAAVPESTGDLLVVVVALLAAGSWQLKRAYE